MNEAQEALVVENQRLVYYVAHRFRRRAEAVGVEFDDLVATGMIGLCKAARVYDSSRSKFVTFAVRCIENEMRMLLRKARRIPQTTPITMSRERDESDHRESAWFRCEADLSGVEWRDFSRRLSEREQSLLALAWAGYTQKDIARRLGISQSYVSRMLGRLERLWNQSLQPMKRKGG